MTINRILATVMLAGAALSAAPRQTPAPATEIYLARLAGPTAQLGLGIFSWINISNNPGYDNQPSFLPDSTGLLFSSNRDGKQMDVYRYDLAARAVKQITNTPEGEYSPTVTPDRRTFSAIRTEADSTQRLWRFDLDGSNPRLILENVKPVGYHAWIDDTHLALFILGSGGGAPATLQLADTKTGLATAAATGIGRSILIRPTTGTVTYVTSSQPRMIKEWDPKTRATRDLIAPIEGSQDCAWLPDGRLLMARNTTISVWDPGSTTWAVFAALSPSDRPGSLVSPGVSNITRMAVSPDGTWLAFVAEPVAK